MYQIDSSSRPGSEFYLWVVVRWTSLISEQGAPHPTLDSRFSRHDGEDHCTTWILFKQKILFEAKRVQRGLLSTQPGHIYCWENLRNPWPERESKQRTRHGRVDCRTCRSKLTYVFVVLTMLVSHSLVCLPDATCLLAGRKYCGIKSFSFSAASILWTDTTSNGGTICRMEGNLLWIRSSI